MNAHATSIKFALLCFLLGLEGASALMGFSFGNLMFSLHLCDVPGPLCHMNCSGPHAPHNYCNNLCTNRRLDSSSSEVQYSEAACDFFDTSSRTYTSCMEGAQQDCEETEYDASYAEDSSSYAGDVNSSNGTTPIASRMSFLPYIVAGTVASMFLILYVWRKKSKEQQLRNEDLLADDESFKGSVAQRNYRAKASTALPPSVIEMEGDTTGYALA